MVRRSFQPPQVKRAGKVGKYFPITTFRRLIAHTRLTFILFQSGLALNLFGGKASGGDDKFFVVVKSLTVFSESLKVSVRPGDTVEALLRRVRKKWSDLAGVLEAHFPEGEAHKAHVSSCDFALENGTAVPSRAPCLDPKATLTQCGIKRRVPEPLVFITAPEVVMLNETKVREMRPPAVAAAQMVSVLLQPRPRRTPRRRLRRDPTRNLPRKSRRRRRRWRRATRLKPPRTR